MQNPASLTGKYLAGAWKSYAQEAPPLRQSAPAAAARRQRQQPQERGFGSPLGLFVASPACPARQIDAGERHLYQAARSTSMAAAPSPAARRVGQRTGILRQGDQRRPDPIGRTPRSNAGHLHWSITPIRELFAGVPAARERGYGPGDSPSTSRAALRACQGDGVLKVNALPAHIYVPCDVCPRQALQRETLEVHYKGKSGARSAENDRGAGARILQRRAHRRAQAEDPARCRPGLRRARPVRHDALGRRGAAREAVAGAVQADTGRTLYILDEPTTGLHFQDITCCCTCCTGCATTATA